MEKKNLKILQLGKFYPVKGGVEKVMYDLMVGLSERGIDCDMLCAAGQGGRQSFVINSHARLTCCKTWLKAAATMISPEMIFTLRKECTKYDIIHVHHPDPMACLALFLSGYKGKVVLHWHSDIQKQKLLLKFYNPLLKWMLRRADVIVGTTPVYLSGSPFLKHVQQKAVYLPIGIEQMCPSQEEVQAVRAQYQGKKIIFTLGRLVEYKGYRYLVEAARYLDDGYVILIGGNGPLKKELETAVRTFGVQAKVKLLGRLTDEELPVYYGACDVFCLSSVQKTEAFGIVQIEAMSCGKPVIATNIPQSGVAWVNKHGVSGINVTPGEPKELAAAIREITQNENTYKAYAEGAEERYKEIFTKEMMIQKCLNIYSNCYEQ